MEPASVRARPAGVHRKFPGLRAVMALMLREMSTTYGRSPGGYLWAVLEPLAAVALMSVIFSLAFQSPPLGTSFPLFYATGVVPFMAYQDLTSKLGTAIQYSRPLLAYPNVVYVDAIFGRLILNGLTHIVIFALLVGGIVIIWDLPFFFDLPKFINALGMLFCFSLGIGALNCYIMSRFPIWQRVWAILNRPMFIISGIFILLDSVPDPYREYLYLNPVAQILSQSRSAFYPFYEPTLVSPIYVYTVSTICGFFGFLLLHRHHTFILDEGA